jgi:hypothetical protein
MGFPGAAQCVKLDTLKLLSVEVVNDLLTVIPVVDIWAISELPHVNPMVLAAERYIPVV